MSKKQPRFPQLDRLADYREDAHDPAEWGRKRGRHRNTKREWVPVDEYIGKPDDD